MSKLSIEDFKSMEKGTVFWNVLGDTILKNTFVECTNSNSIWGNFPPELVVIVSGGVGDNDIYWRDAYSEDELSECYLDKAEAIKVAEERCRKIREDSVTKAKETLARAEAALNEPIEIRIVN